MPVSASPAPEPAAAPTARRSVVVPPAPRPTPLWVVLVFTFVNSIGGGVVTTGFSFLGDSAYHVTTRQNYLLGLVQGVLYVVAALAVGPLLARTIARASWVSMRGALLGLMLALAVLCALPWAAPRLGLSGPVAFAVLVGGYSALTGVLWPIVESYMSGGRSEKRLRSAIGVFNVVWSSALVAAYVGMGPLIKRFPLELILAVGGLHLAMALLLPLFTPNPAAHVHEDHAPAPAVYARLLSVFRMQLVTSYLVYSALTPFLRDACVGLAIPQPWWTPIAATWLAARVVTFAVLERWHGWHGRWATTGVGAAALLAGFGLAVFSTRLGVPALVGGLAVFGVGMGIIYCAALYYGLSVGHAQVDAGGKHEAMIGLGYGGGPICGLVAIQATGGETNYQVLMLGLVSVAAVLIVGLSLWRALGHASTNPERSARATATRPGERGKP